MQPCHWSEQTADGRLRHGLDTRRAPGMRLSDQARRGLAKGKARVVDHAERLVARSTNPYDRMSRLTPIAASIGEPRYLCPRLPRSSPAR